MLTLPGSARGWARRPYSLPRLRRASSQAAGLVLWWPIAAFVDSVIAYGQSPLNINGALTAGSAAVLSPTPELGYAVGFNGLSAGTTTDPPPPPTPTPVDCVLSTTETITSSSQWSALANGVQTRNETWTRDIVTPARDGGSCQPTRTGTRTATVSPADGPGLP